MKNIRFNLNKNANGSFTIIAIYSVNNSYQKLFTKIKIAEKDWDKRKQIPKRSYHSYMELMEYLDRFQKTIHKYLLDLENKKVYKSKKEVKKELKELLFDDVKYNFFDHLTNYIEMKLRDKKIKPVSVKRYSVLYNKLAEWYPDLKFEDIDISWYLDFVEEMEYQNYSANYINTLTKGLKAFLRYCFESGISKNNIYTHRKMNYAGNVADTIYLDDKEIMMLYDFDYDDARLRNAVNIFVLGCYTGLRYADMINIDIEKDMILIEGNEYLKINTSKTGERVTIPLHPIVKKILKEEINKLANPVMNRYIKEAAKYAGINEHVNIEKRKGGNRYMVNKRKYELITTHTARRSFATNAYKAGIPASMVMKITGHRTEKQFMDYIKISGDENAVRLHKHEFFKVKLKKVE